MQTSDSAPTVSVVIPAYNPWYLKAALDSALNQTYARLEILICDDCRTGEIKAVVDEVAPSEPENARFSLSKIRSDTGIIDIGRRILRD